MRLSPLEFLRRFPFIQKKRFNKQSASSPSVANHTYERAAEERDPTVSLASFLSLAKGFKAEYPESHVFILSLRVNVHVVYQTSMDPAITSYVVCVCV